MIVERKKKICIQCNISKFIWAYGRCKECDRKVNSAIKNVKKKEKKESISELKKKLDAVFSLYIRYRWSYLGTNKCVTCGDVKPIKELQCGHFYSRRYLSIRWVEDNTHCQCKKCNLFLSGNMIEYYKFMEAKYGKQRIEMLDIQKNNSVKLNRFYYENMISHYKSEVEKLKQKYE